MLEGVEVGLIAVTQVLDVDHTSQSMGSACTRSSHEHYCGGMKERLEFCDSPLLQSATDVTSSRVTPMCGGHEGRR